MSSARPKAATDASRGAAGARILLIDDDKRLADMVGRYLSQNGFELLHRADSASGIAALRDGADQPPDLILLDLMLPDGDGLDLCRDIRALGTPAAAVPILMLTARGETTDRVVGLELGADDYLPKPFEPRELLARVRALLRRARPAARPGPAVAATDDVEVLRFGRMEIDLGARVVRVDGAERAMTGYQFELLLALARNAGRVMSRERLMDLVRGEALEAFDRSIDVHVAKIRQAIEDDPRRPRRLLTVRGSGYVLSKSPEPGP
ncbi:MAG: response regulator transcription factor [Burkholderiaceae bacterium]|nr:response regulator transcription factor [Burkholderiaceae bacterium]